MEIILSQPASSQCDPSPRRAAVDTGSEEPRTPPRSPAIGTGSEKPGTSRAPFKTSLDGFLNPNFTSTEQECVLPHQPDVGIDEKKTTATSQQAAVREEFASPTGKRQQQGTTAWATEQNKQFDQGRYIDIVTFLEKRMFACRVYCFACFSLVFCLRSLLCTFPVLSTKCRSRYERRYDELWMHRMRELLYQKRSVHHLDFSPIEGILCVSLYYLIAFKMISLS